MLDALEGQERRPALDEPLDRRRAQGSDPSELCRQKFFADSRLGDQAPVADKHDALQAKARTDFLDLLGQGCRIADIPPKTSIATG